MKNRVVMNTGVVANSAITGGIDLVVSAGRAGVFRFIALSTTSYQVSRIA